MSEVMQQDAVDVASLALSKYNIEKVSLQLMGFLVKMRGGRGRTTWWNGFFFKCCLLLKVAPATSAASVAVPVLIYCAYFLFPSFLFRMLLRLSKRNSIKSTIQRGKWLNGVRCTFVVLLPVYWRVGGIFILVELPSVTWRHECAAKHTLICNKRSHLPLSTRTNFSNVAFLFTILLSSLLWVYLCQLGMSSSGGTSEVMLHTRQNILYTSTLVKLQFCCSRVGNILWIYFDSVAWI